MTNNERQPISDVLAGMELHPLEAGWTALEAFLLIKMLDDNGHPSWVYRTTHQLNREELLGALTVQIGLLEPSYSRSGIANEDAACARGRFRNVAIKHTTFFARQQRTSLR